MTTFYTWIKQFKEDNSPIGDLARQMEFDNQFPRSRMHATILSYMRLDDSYTDVIPVFEEAFSDFKESKKNL